MLIESLKSYPSFNNGVIIIYPDNYHMLELFEL